MGSRQLTAGLTSKQLEIFTNLCICNGIDLDESPDRRKEVVELQIFFHSYPALVGLKFFPNLHTLKVVSQDVTTLRPLRDAPNLQELWVCEAKLENLFGLESCKKLEKLYLYDNQISDIRPIQVLQKLETLWLNSNRISNVESLKTIRLTQVNLASNRISHLGKLSVNGCVECLNLSNNPISNFCSLYPLTLANSLYSISLSDAKEGGGPLVQCKSYLPWLTYHFPYAVIADGFELSNSVQSKLEARKHKLKAFVELSKLNNQQLVVNKRFEEIWRHLRADITTQLSQMTEIFAKTSQVTMRSAAVRQIITDRVDFWSKQYEDFRSLMSEIKGFLADLHRLKAEVHHVALESGSTVNLAFISAESPVWSAVEKLLTDSFCAEQFGHNWGVTMRNLCKMSENLTVRTADGAGELYFLQQSNLCTTAEDQLKVIYKGLMLNAKMTLTKNLHSATHQTGSDSRRGFFVNLIVVQAVDDSITLDDIPEVLESQQSFIEPCDLLEEIAHLTLKYTDDGIENTAEPQKPICHSQLHVEQHLNLRCCDVSYNQLNNVYLVSVEFFVDTRSSELTSFLIENCLNHNSVSDNCGILASRLWTNEILQNSDVEDAVAEDLTSLPKWSNMSDFVTENNFKRLTEAFLCGCQLKSLSGLEELLSLEKLTISHNQLTNLTGLPTPSLVELNISFNQLINIPIDMTCQKLSKLDLSGNCISDLAELFDNITIFAPKIEWLNIRFNQSIPSGDDLLKAYLSRLPLLQQFNGNVIVTPAESEWTCSWLDHSWAKDTPYPLLSNRSSVEMIKLFEDPVEELDSSWNIKITTLDLADCNLVDGTNLTSMVNVKFINLNGNHLKDLQFTLNWQQLQEVSADNSRITDASGLAELQLLQTVNLCHNHLSDLEFCRKLRLLAQLQVSHNKIPNLSGLEDLRQLEELNISHNLIATAKDLKVLQTFTSLLCLTLHGNPVCMDTSCRHSVLYHCQKLAVLDEDLITADELKKAAQLIGFTVSLEFLSNHFGQVDFAKLTTLKFPNGELHSVTLEPKNPLTSVTEVDLSCNKLTDLGGLIYLRSLSKLNLESNEICCLSNCIKTFPEFNEDDTYCRGLTKLILNKNRIHRTKRMCLEIFPQLDHLELRSNNIAKVHGIDKLFELKLLDLSDNRIRSVDQRETEKLLKLKVLLAARNKLKNLDFITGLQELQELDVSNNCIQSCLNLKSLEGLVNIRYFSCASNPVAEKNLYRHFVLNHLPFLLELDKHPVEHSDHEKAENIMKNYKESTTRVLKTASLGTLVAASSTDNSRNSGAGTSAAHSAVRSRLISRQTTANRRLISLPPIVQMDLMSRNLLMRLNTGHLRIDNNIFDGSISVSPAQIHLGSNRNRRRISSQRSSTDKPTDEE